MKQNKQKRNKQHTSEYQIRKSFIENIHHRDSLPSSLVTSSITGLARIGEPGDEKYIIPLLDCEDKLIAAEALFSLHIHYPETPQLKDRIVVFASTYPCEGEESELQLQALIAMEHYAQDNSAMFKKLVEIAECYKDICKTSDDSESICAPSDALSTNAYAWEALARLCNDKIRGDEHTELTWNPHSTTSEKIRERIRKKVHQRNLHHVKPAG